MPGGFCKYVVAGLRSEFLCSSLPEKCAVEAFYRPVEGASLSDLPVGPEALLRIGTGAASHFGCKVQVVQIYIFMRFAAFQHEPEHPSSIGTSFHRLNITKKQHTHTHTRVVVAISHLGKKDRPQAFNMATTHHVHSLSIEGQLNHRNNVCQHA